jgi:phosphoglycolate phosphatase
MNVVLLEQGFAPHSLSDYRGFVGDGVTMLARRALPPGRRDEATVAACVARMREVYAPRVADQTVPYDGIPALLDSLELRGVAMAVLSNKPDDLTTALVARLLGRWRFAVVFGERTGVPRKPDPAGAFEAAGRLGLDPSAIVYVGDTPTDMATARAAGMLAVGVTWGFRDEAELRDAGADAIVHRPSEILDHLEVPESRVGD